MTPANRPEEEGVVPLADDIKRQRLRLIELHIDRAYVNSPVVDDVFAAGGTVFAKPWDTAPTAPGCFPRATSRSICEPRLITCPAGEMEMFEPGNTVEFDPEACGAVSASR